MKLCHYTSRTGALEHILPTGQLRFGTLPRTNDPREFLPIWFGIAGFVDEKEPLTTRDPFVLIEEADELLRDSVRLLCFTEDLPSNRNLLRYGTGPRRSRMWAQYAENHTGVCLCFDGKRLIDAAHEQLQPTSPSRTLMHDRVRYVLEGEYPAKEVLLQPEAEADLSAYIERMVSNHARELFLPRTGTGGTKRNTDCFFEVRRPTTNRSTSMTHWRRWSWGQAVTACTGRVSACSARSLTPSRTCSNGIRVSR